MWFSVHLKFFYLRKEKISELKQNNFFLLPVLSFMNFFLYATQGAGDYYLPRVISKNEAILRCTCFCFLAGACVIPSSVGSMYTIIERWV